jgi:hypothetical protein
MEKGEAAESSTKVKKKRNSRSLSFTYFSRSIGSEKKLTTSLSSNELNTLSSSSSSSPKLSKPGRKNSNIDLTQFIEPTVLSPPPDEHKTSSTQSSPTTERRTSSPGHFIENGRNVTISPRKRNIETCNMGIQRTRSNTPVVGETTTTTTPSTTLIDNGLEKVDNMTTSSSPSLPISSSSTSFISHLTQPTPKINLTCDGKPVHLVASDAIEEFLQSPRYSKAFIKRDDGVLHLLKREYDEETDGKTTDITCKQLPFCFVCDGEKCNHEGLNSTVDYTGSRSIHYKGVSICFPVYRKIVVGSPCYREIMKDKEYHGESQVVVICHRFNRFYMDIAY